MDLKEVIAIPCSLDVTRARCSHRSTYSASAVSPLYLVPGSHADSVHLRICRTQNLALWSSAFLAINWAFGIGFVPRPVILADEIFLYAVAPAFTFMIPPMVILDWPRDRNPIYQTVLTIAVWMWSVYTIIFM